MGGIDYLSGSSVTLMKTDGFTNWGRVSNTARVFKDFFEIDVQVAALFDRDYRSDEDVAQFETEMSNSGTYSFVLPCKEIENLLLVPRAVQAVVEKYSTKKLTSEMLKSIVFEYEKIVGECRDAVFSMRMGHFIQYRLSKNPKMDMPTLSSDFQKKFSEDWVDAEYRKSVVPGKAVFSSLARYVQEKFGVTLTAARVADELLRSEVDVKVLKILVDFNNYFNTNP